MWNRASNSVANKDPHIKDVSYRRSSLHTSSENSHHVQILQEEPEMLKLKEMINSRRFDHSCSIIFFFSGIIYIIRNFAAIPDSNLMTMRIILVSALYFLVSYLFVIREMPEDTPTVRESIIPMVSMVTPVLISNISTLFEAHYAFMTIGTSIIIAGLLIIFLSFHNLKKSFGILPSRRKIVMSGLYAVIRHPVYAGEVVMGIGLILVHLNYVSIALLTIGGVATIFRIRIEEKKLSVDEEYTKYQSKVRYRLVPLAW